MILLDTNHLSVLWFATGKQKTTLLTRLGEASDKRLATTVISLEEILRGWLAKINQEREYEIQIPFYQRLAYAVKQIAKWEMIDFDALAVLELEGLRRKKVRIGVMDLKIASIALVHDALLLTENLKDFRRVPGLRADNWLAEPRI